MEKIEGKYRMVAGHRLYVETAGNPGNPPVIFVHTAGQHGIQWRFVLEEMAGNGFFAVAPDLPGHGKSLVRDFELLHTIHDFAEVVFELAQAMKLDQPVLVGCSIGGDIVLDIAAHHSPALRAVVSCEGALRTPTIPAQTIERGLEDSGIPSFGDQGILGGLSLCGTKADPERVREIGFTRRSGDPKVYHNDLKAWISHDIRELAEKITCPVLMVWGDEDYIVPYHFVEEAVQGIPNANLMILNGIGHYPGTEYPGFAQVVLGFLDSLARKD